MKRIFTFIFSLLFFAGLKAQISSTILFDDGWRFHRGGAQGAEYVEYDDSKWRPVDLPHDWSIEDIPGTNSPFDPDAISQVSGGFTVGGTGWYRKTFTVDASEEQRVFIIFDGVYMFPDVYVNGELVGIHPYGYTSFYFDITDKVKKGEKNVIAVQVKNEGQNSRWYTGSGIYRHVWLKVTGSVYFQEWGSCINTTSSNNGPANIYLRNVIINKSKRDVPARIVTNIFSPQQQKVLTLESETIASPDSSNKITQQGKITNPQLWSLGHPLIYKAITEIYSENKLIDKQEATFGIRSISFGTNGFLLNGEIVKLKGGCVHHDNGPLGSRAYDRAEIRRVQLLKQAGFNAIRCSHNPPSPAFLAACDSIGMLVIDEAFDMWHNPNNPHDYHLFFDEWWKRDIESMVNRDRNHPSVIIWSIGNEIRGMNTPEVVRVADMLSRHVRSLDSTRPVTAAVNSLGSDKDPFISALDVAGYNYAAGGDHGRKDVYAEDHERLPNRIMFGSESYALEAFLSWTQVENKPWVLGDFVWTAFDYIGEASIGWRGYYQMSDFYPWNLAFCGDIDICGWKRPQSYYRDALWKKNQLSLFVKPPAPSFPINPKKESWSKWEWRDAVSDWNWDGYENKPIEVEVYSSCETVELFLNGKSIGKKPTGREQQYMATWQVPYQKGKLTAVGYNGRKKIAEYSLSTAEEPAHLVLNADRNTITANGQDLSYITIELKDKNGVISPKAENLVKFSVSGDASIVAVGNANPMSVESYQSNERKLWKGKCLVIIKSGKQPGEIKLTATADGIPSASITVSSVK